MDETWDALKTLSKIGKQAPFSREETRDKNGRLSTFLMDWLERHKGQDLVKANISVIGKFAEIQVNSDERSNEMQRKINHRLSRGRSLLVDIEYADMSLDIESDEDGLFDEGANELMDLPEVQEKIKQMADQHWRDWLNAELPALKGQTPHAASKNKKGLELLEALLLDFEGRESDDLFSPDVNWLRQQLGLK